MKNKFLKVFLLLLLIPFITLGAEFSEEKLGYILLQVEKNGEAWYFFPTSGSRYYLGRPADAFSVMKKLALGAKHDYIINNDIFPARLRGLILLDVEKNGEAYYIYPQNGKKYYLGRPADAFRIMSQLGQGISNADLINIPVSQISNTPQVVSKAEEVLQNVPFTSQAPLGKWSDLRQEDGCEEASALMAVKWANNETLTPDEALKDILGASDYILKKYKEYRDVSVPDTLNWIIKDYFNYQKAAVLKNVSISEIITQLNKGNVIIAPMNGQLLGNPYYTQPGPINHVLVIRGYDPVKQVFITNDPGTRRGELYKYNVDVLFTAIRAYPTGSHALIEKIEKDVIVVWR